MRFAWQVTLALAAFSAVVVGAVWLALSDRRESPPSTGYRTLSGAVAEEFVYRVGREPFPRISCQSCRFGKLKAEPFSFGAFSTIEIEGLVLNAPSGKDVVKMSAADKQSESPVTANVPLASASPADVLDALHLKSQISTRMRALRRIAGITISGLCLNRMEGDSLAPVLKARCLKTVRKRIAFFDVELFDGSARRSIPEATLTLKPSPRLVWARGALDLSSFFESLR